MPRRRPTATEGKPSAAARAKWGGRIPYSLLNAHEKQERDREFDAHGGVIVLHGGPWNGSVYWADDYTKEPTGSSRRLGYAATAEVEPGVFYEAQQVCQFNPAQLPKVEPVAAEDPWWKTTPTFCACGERLLLSGRDTCERCRLGHVGPALVWPPVAPAADSEPAWDEPAVLTPDEPVEPPTVEPEPQEPAPSAEETAAFVWACLAPHYDR